MIVSLKSGSSFGIAPGETILQAAESNRIQLAYSCKIGRCNACKSKVIQGESQALYEELGLTASEKAEGWILSCVRMALTDMSLDVEDLGCFILPQVKTLPCRISRIDKLTSDVVCVALRLPPTAEFSFIPASFFIRFLSSYALAAVSHLFSLFICNYLCLYVYYLLYL
jgi:CDP-4-dehydro-6-deoxyglucose reductase